MHSLTDMRAQLEAVGQGHVLSGWAALDAAGRARLMAQLRALDWAALPRWIALAQGAQAPAAAPEELATLAPPAQLIEQSALSAAQIERGWRALREGRVATFVVAGGDGTRLGFEGPKGAFPAAPISEAPLFALLARGVLATARRVGAACPLWVMTSPQNHAQTVAFFEQHRFFGLPPRDVFFVTQGVLPSFDPQGRLLMSAPDRLAVHPDGHGGSLRALAEGGALDEMAARGIDLISYLQVDNPLARVLDPGFIGLHLDPARSSGQMAAKAVLKRAPEERVGVFAQRAGRLTVVEYSDLPAQLAQARAADGGLLLRAGNVAQHLLSRDFVASWTAEGHRLPLHRALKPVQAWRPEWAQPRPVQAVKLETFVFDALATVARPALLLVPRAQAFAPIKNAQGVDSPESSRRAQMARAAVWLEAAGVQVARRADGALDCEVEIDPLFALEAADLRARDDLPERIEPQTRWLGAE